MEIFGAFEETVADYQEENDRLRRLLRITPEIKLCRIGSYVDLQMATLNKNINTTISNILLSYS